MSQEAPSPEIVAPRPERTKTQAKATARDPGDLCDELDPVAYIYETWSDLSESWETGIRQSRATIPDNDSSTVRNITPLVSISSVESMLSVEQFRQELEQELGRD